MVGPALLRAEQVHDGGVRDVEHPEVGVVLDRARRAVVEDHHDDGLAVRGIGHLQARAAPVARAAHRVPVDRRAGRSALLSPLEQTPSSYALWMQDADPHVSPGIREVRIRGAAEVGRVVGARGAGVGVVETRATGEAADGRRRTIEDGFAGVRRAGGHEEKTDGREAGADAHVGWGSSRRAMARGEGRRRGTSRTRRISRGSVGRGGTRSPEVARHEVEGSRRGAIRFGMSGEHGDPASAETRPRDRRLPVRGGYPMAHSSPCTPIVAPPCTGTSIGSSRSASGLLRSSGLSGGMRPVATHAIPRPAAIPRAVTPNAA